MLLVVAFLIGAVMSSEYTLNGLVYQPLVQSVSSWKEPKGETIEEFLSQSSNNKSPDLVVEPVRIWDEPYNFDWSDYGRPDHYNIGESVGQGKVYKASEKDKFKMDLFEAYTTAFKQRGFDEDRAIEFAKRIVAQDALESRWGQSSLVKHFNFGGVKDFRQGSDAYITNTTEHVDGKYIVKKQPFRKFKNLDEYVNYKIDLFGNNNYDAYSYAPEMLYRRLTSAKKKYATDPDYERKLNNIYYMLWGR